ncbi:MAG: lactate racemase domain-containing protein [Deltaproteobacteria bacterium]|nr:lactate racemase domain-containing protein [Deltaproteobacteria bacterium]
MNEQIIFGDKTIPVNLPEDVISAPPGLSTTLEPVDDIEGEIRNALKNPLGRSPLHELVKPGAKVTIAFDDPTVPCFAPVWEPAIKQVIAELEKGGVKPADITLVSAGGIHRKFTRMELAKIIGEDLVKRYGYRLTCHDAEDGRNLTHLGVTPNGYDVEVNKCIEDSDLTVYVNTVVWRGFNGGWKSICVGLASYRCIRWHHTPDSMSMSMNKNKMHTILDEMGALIEEKLGKNRIYKVETVLSNPLQVHKVWSGGVNECRQAALKLMRSQLKPRREIIGEKADIVLYGIPNWSPYAAFSIMNPMLTMLSTGLGYFGGVIEAMGKPGCTVIMASPVPDVWNHDHHPTHREIWNRILPHYRDPYQIVDRFEDDFANRPEYIYKYRFCHGFHPMHGIMVTHPLKRLRHAGHVIVAGAQKPELVSHLGFEPAVSVESAIAMARERQGKDASIAFVKYPMLACRE